MRNLRSKLTYANVMATIAVFIALGGASYAATQLPKNSVGAKQIKKNSVTGAKVKGNSLTGAKIKESTLAIVPSAANAQTLGGLSAAQLTEGSKVRCPSGTRLAAGVCFESATREATTLSAALGACGRDNLRLPLQSELIAFQMQTTPPEYEWAESYYLGPEGTIGTAVLANPKTVSFVFADSATKRPYRCVMPPTN